MATHSGYTLVRRKGRPVRIHQLRPGEQCNTDDAGRRPERVMSGDPELLAATLGGRRAEICRHCFTEADRAYLSQVAPVDPEDQTDEEGDSDDV
jgi:hypothetical protein